MNKAGKAALLRVPGFGVRNVKRIVNVRRFRALTLADLAKLKISIAKSQYFIVTADHNPATKQIDTVHLPKQFAPQPQQLVLFEARTGEL